MADIVIPRTPSPGSNASKPANTSPPPVSSSDLTPPPSTQIPRHAEFAQPETVRTINAIPASPPATTKPTPVTKHDAWKGHFPSIHEVHDLSEEQLRDLVAEVLPALGEARMNLAHTKLQLNLLSIETAEAAQRAEVEHDLTRREFEVLQAGSPDLRARTNLLPDPRSPLAQVQQHLEVAVEKGRELENHNFQLENRLKQAKKVIKHLHGKNCQLSEHNQLLRDRIKQNREHANAMRPSRDHTPRHAQHGSPHRQKATPSGVTSSARQNPLDALLMADQILSADPSSLPSTPSPHRAMRPQAGHVRGAHSLSSLPSTPSRSRPMTADDRMRTPVHQIIHTAQVPYSAPAQALDRFERNRAREREERDSTISASDDEALTDEDLPASQASQAASSMLRRYAPNVQDNVSNVRPSTQERLVQSKLMGHVTKAKQGSQRSDKYADDNIGDEERSKKRQRIEDREGHGLGIWASSSR